MLPKILSILLCLWLVACNVLPQAPDATSTRRFTAPTLAPSPTVPILNSDEIYGDSIHDGQNDPTAAALPRDSALPPLQTGDLGTNGAIPVQLQLSDDTNLSADLYQTTGDGRGIGVLLIGEAKTAWTALAVDLMASGFTALVVELPNYQSADDMDALLSSLSEEGTVDPSRIVVIGSQAGADMALLGCAIYEICDAVVLLSPQSRNTLLNVLPNFNPRKMLVIAGRSDTESYAAASGLATSFAEGSQFIEQSTGRGTGLLTLNSELNRSIITWLLSVWN